MHLLGFGKVPKLRVKPPGLIAKQGMLCFFWWRSTAESLKWAHKSAQAPVRKLGRKVCTVLPHCGCAPVDSMVSSLFQHLGQLPREATEKGCAIVPNAALLWMWAKLDDWAHPTRKGKHSASLRTQLEHISDQPLICPFVVLVWDILIKCNLGCLRFRNLPASTSWVLGLNCCVSSNNSNTTGRTWL